MEPFIILAGKGMKKSDAEGIRIQNMFQLKQA
jgi:hypothetical protein